MRKGGSLLNENWIITAGHCGKNKQAEKLLVRAGSSIKGEQGQVRSIKKIIIHPKFHGHPTDFDVAVVLVKEPFKIGPAVNVIKLPDGRSNAVDGQSLLLAGFGKITDTERSSKLMAQFVSILDWKTCKKQIREVTKRMLCLKGQKDKGLSYFNRR